MRKSNTLLNPHRMKTLAELVAEAQEKLAEIRQHPDFKALDYYPDCTLGDAAQALNELSWVVLPPMNHIDIPSFEGFFS